MELQFVPVTTEQDQQDLTAMAAEIWGEYWPAHIGQAQTDYMIEQYQSLEAIQRDMAHHGYEYWFLVDENGNRVGYTGGHDEPETNRFFISKIYIYAHERGKHYTSKVVSFYVDLCRNRGWRAMYLTVNKYNELGVRAYKGNDFKIIDSVETDIGEGFIMDDFIMEKEV